MTARRRRGSGEELILARVEENHWRCALTGSAQLDGGMTTPLRHAQHHAASRAGGPGSLMRTVDWTYWPGSSKRRRKRSSIRLPNDGFDFAASLSAPFAARAPG